MKETKVKRICSRCQKTYKGSPSSNVCESPKCNLVKAVKILREATIKAQSTQDPKAKEIIILKAVRRII